MEILESSRFLDIIYIGEKKCLVQKCKNFCSTEEFRAAQQKTVHFFVEKGCKNFISDSTNAGLLKKEDTDWVAEVITPQLVKAGMMQLNMVLPTSAFTKITLMNLEKAEVSAQNTRIEYFASLDSALMAIA